MPATGDKNITGGVVDFSKRRRLFSMVKKREKKQASGSPLARELKRDDDEAPDFDAYLVSATVHPPYFVFCVQQSKQNNWHRR